MGNRSVHQQARDGKTDWHLLFIDDDQGLEFRNRIGVSNAETQLAMEAEPLPLPDSTLTALEIRQAVAAELANDRLKLSSERLLSTSRIVVLRANRALR